MDTLDRLMERAVQGLALVGALGVIALLVHVAGDVLSRNLLDRPIPATNEIASHYYMVAIAFLPLPWVESRGAMVRVELFDALMPKWALRLSEATVILLCICVYLMLAHVTWGTAMKNFSSGAFKDVLGMRLPIWPTYFILPIGFGLAALAVLWRPFSIMLKARET